ncbi:RNA 2',3'-cyclic phosphodiesterase [Virgibacillus oceani]
MSSHYFIAIHLPETLQMYFSTWQEDLKREFPYKQWPHKEDLHITLKYLGAMDDNKLTLLENKLQDINRFDHFSLETGELGTFGNPKKPRVLWAGVKKTEALMRLQRNVEKICADVGFEKEKRDYRPHITLAKKWDGAEIKNINQILGSKTLIKQTLPVEDIVLFRIHPKENPKYEAVAKILVQGGGNTGSAY